MTLPIVALTQADPTTRPLAWKPYMRGTRRGAIVSCRKGHLFHLTEFKFDAETEMADDGVTCPECDKIGWCGFCVGGLGFHTLRLIGWVDAYGPDPYCAWIKGGGEVHIAKEGSTTCFCGDERACVTAPNCNIKEAAR